MVKKHFLGGYHSFGYSNLSHIQERSSWCQINTHSVGTPHGRKFISHIRLQKIFAKKYRFTVDFVLKTDSLHQNHRLSYPLLQGLTIAPTDKPQRISSYFTLERASNNYPRKSLETTIMPDPYMAYLSTNLP